MTAIDRHVDIEVMPDGSNVEVAIVDRDGIVVAVNSAWKQAEGATGIDTGSKLIDLFRFVGSNVTHASLANGIAAVISGRIPSFSGVMSDGALPEGGKYRIRAENLTGADGTFLITRTRDQRSLIDEAIRTNEARLRSLFHESGEVVAVLDETGGLIFSNPAFIHMFGYPEADFAPGPRLDLIHPEDVESFERTWAETLELSGVPQFLAMRMRNADDVWIWIEGTLLNLLHDSAVNGVVVNVRDVSRQRHLEAELRHLALHDPLTELANRTLLTDRINQALRQAAASGVQVGLLFVDLDNFKSVNDKFGHTIGDSMLRNVTDRLVDALSVSNTLARVGGDEFAVLIPTVNNECYVDNVAQRLLKVMQAPFTGLTFAGDLYLSISIGIVLSRQDDEKPDSLLRRGSDAMQSAKKAGRGRSARHTVGMTDDAARRLTLETDVRSAAERGEFSLHYQPILNLETLAVSKVEALLRWNHPVFGQVPPNEFVPIAEASNQIAPVGTWVLKEACRQLAIWGRGSPTMSVNVSAAQFRESNLVETIATELQFHCIDPRQLQVEITETVLIDDVEIIIGTLHQLREIGIHVTIDDFGTGYSSLRYLRDLPVDTIKIDRSFISGLESDAGAQAIVEGITSLAHAIGLMVTAEGIETPDQLRRLREMGCDFGQGYHLARPTPAGATPPGLALTPSA